MNQEEIKCPKCKSTNVVILSDTETFDGTVYNVKCNDCDFQGGCV